MTRAIITGTPAAAVDRALRISQALLTYAELQACTWQGLEPSLSVWIIMLLPRSVSFPSISLHSVRKNLLNVFGQHCGFYSFPWPAHSFKIGPAHSFKIGLPDFSLGFPTVAFLQPPICLAVGRGDSRVMTSFCFQTDVECFWHFRNSFYFVHSLKHFFHSLSHRLCMLSWCGG